MRFFLLLFLTLHFGLRAQTKVNGEALATSALSLVNPNIIYNPAYFNLEYPMGDVPAQYGVCTDVIIRAYRLHNIDLQVLVHEDMRANFKAYPKNWGLSKPDKNIDHRRVPNLMCFFERQGAKKPISQNPSDYKQGDIVCWDLGQGILHIGLVVKTNPQVELLHNIGGGQILEACLFKYTIIGHYRYWP